MTRTSGELRRAAYVSKRLALEANDPERQAKLFAMAAELERQAHEADQARSGKDSADPGEASAAKAPATPRKGRWITRRRKAA